MLRFMSRSYKPPRPPFLDVTSQRFERLLVLHLLGSHRNNIYFRCRCDCGAELDVMRQSLTSGRQKSCGCWVGDHASRKRASQLHPAEYAAWNSMLRRCDRKSHAAYHHYGGRGISVCERWRDDFWAFFEDMGPRPSPDLSIERIDNDGNYEPSNCKWATRKEQGLNRRPHGPHRRSKMITHEGRTQKMADWAREIGITPQIIYKRLRRGWPVAKALQKEDLRSESMAAAWADGRRRKAK